jgi:hypothetical protein
LFFVFESITVRTHLNLSTTGFFVCIFLSCTRMPLAMPADSLSQDNVWNWAWQRTNDVHAGGLFQPAWLSSYGWSVSDRNFDSYVLHVCWLSHHQPGILVAMHNALNSYFKTAFDDSQPNACALSWS